MNIRGLTEKKGQRPPERSNRSLKLLPDGELEGKGVFGDMIGSGLVGGKETVFG